MVSDSTLPISLTVTHRGVSHPLSVLPDSTLSILQAQLERLTSVAPSNQKLLFKGKKLVLDENANIAQAGLRDGMRVQMLGPTVDEIEELRRTEDEQHKKDRILRERATKPQAKVRSTASSSTNALKYRFHSLQPLPHLPNPAAAQSLLKRLADDLAIRHIMERHEFSVGVLTELAPHEHPQLLGLNVNAGQAVKLRLRTDAYDGFRTYKEVRKVLCHELAHNKYSEHDNNFKELNSKLNKEIVEYERSVSQGTHYLTDIAGGDVYEPSSELEAEAHARVLGGGELSSSRVSGSDSPEERRRRVLEATMKRLQKEEEDLEQSCGTAGPSAMT